MQSTGLLSTVLRQYTMVFEGPCRCFAVMERRWFSDHEKEAKGLLIQGSGTHAPLPIDVCRGRGIVCPHQNRKPFAPCSRAPKGQTDVSELQPSDAVFELLGRSTALGHLMTAMSSPVSQSGICGKENALWSLKGRIP